MLHRPGGMRRILLLLLLAAPLPAAAQDPVFLVRAVNEESGRAVRDILIQVREADTDLVRAEARTDRDGQASIPVAPLQRYAVRAVARGFTARDQVLMAPARGSTSFPIALQQIAPRPPLHKFGAVSGRVLGPGSVPLPGIIVSAESNHAHGASGRTTTEKDGSFQLDVPAGTYQIRTEHSNPYPPFAAIPPFFDVYGRAESAPVVVSADRETSGVVIYPPREQRFRARVRVMSAAGPVTGGRVEWRGGHGRGASATIQPDGTADLGPLERGRFTLTAVTSHKPAQLAGTAAIEITDAPLDEVVIEVRPAATARGRVVGADGRPFRARPGQGLWVMPNTVGSLSTGSTPEPVEVDGHFLVTGLTGGMCLRVAGDDLHTANVTWEGTDYTGRAFRFEPGEAIFGIVIRLAPGSVPYPDDRRCEP